MGFQDRAYETKPARALWLLELSDHWRERDPEFAGQLRAQARQLQSSPSDDQQQSRAVH